MQRILIANRGEVAVRAIRTAERLGFETVAVYSEADQDGTWMGLATTAENLGSALLSESYLSIPAILKAAERSNATAVFPGYGFLSERADFAQAVVDAGLVWIGPRPSVMEKLGDKAEARRLAESVGVPVVPGHDGPQERALLMAAARQLGFPLLIKAVAGGGGRGIRRVDEVEELPEALDEAKAEATRSFAAGEVMFEKLVSEPRHIEVQILGDSFGNVVHLGTRECSLQRRFQKIIEEAPAPNLPDELAKLLCEQALAIANAASYDSIGTVEFLLDGATGEHYFLEVNTRLQVEHPVTEAIAGVDLVELTFLTAFGGSLSELPAPAVRGHAIEARITAEDPWDNFAPQTGVISLLDVPEEHRWDSAIAVGSTIGPLFDSLLGKLIVHGQTRADAIGGLRAALKTVCIGGVVSNTGFLHWLLERPEVAAGTVTTEFVDQVKAGFAADHPEASVVLRACEAARAGGQMLKSRQDTTLAESPWTAIGPARLLPTPVRTPYFFEYRRSVIELMSTPSDDAMDGAAVRINGDAITVLVDAHSVTLRPRSRKEVWRDSAEGLGDGGSEVVAPFPAVVVEVLAVAGDSVEAGSIVVVIEAMKLLHSLKVPRAGNIRVVLVAAGDNVAAGQALLVLAAEAEGR